MDYRAIFLVGAIYLTLGAICLPFDVPFGSFGISVQVLSAVVFSAGLVLFLVGLVNREKWKESGGLSTHRMVIFVAFLMVVSVMVFLLGYLQAQYATVRF
jgi:hypothetical protein